MLRAFRDHSIALHSAEYRELTGQKKTKYGRHTFYFQGDYILQDLINLFVPIYEGNKYIGPFNRSRRCYKGNTIFRVFIARSDEEGELIDAHWFTLSAATRFDRAYTQLPQAIERMEQNTMVKPNYDFDQVGAIEVEATKDADYGRRKGTLPWA